MSGWVGGVIRAGLEIGGRPILVVCLSSFVELLFDGMEQGKRATDWVNAHAVYGDWGCVIVSDGVGGCCLVKGSIYSRRRGFFPLIERS